MNQAVTLNWHVFRLLLCKRVGPWNSCWAHYLSRSLIAFALCVLGVATAFADFTANVQRGSETIEFDCEDSEWTVGFFHEQQKDPPHSTKEYVRHGETVGMWSEILTLQAFPRSAGAASLATALQALRDQRETSCPGITEWHVLDASENSVTYESLMKGTCGGWPAEQSFGRLLEGNEQRFRIQFATRASSMPGDRRELWLRCLARVKVK